jgi:hypothetical protein
MDTNKIDTPTLIVIVILMMGLINGLMSCKTVYLKDSQTNKWSSQPKKSQVTGWNYLNIK